MKWNTTATFVLALILAAFIIAPSAEAQITYTYSYEGAPLPIFRDSANVITVINLWVPRAVTITKVTANVEIDYPRPGDLNVFMYSAIATRTKLLERNCGNTGSVSNITFDDSAPTKYSDVCPTSSGGSYRGNEPLSNYNGQVAAGLWSLAVENNGSDDFIGYLRGFTITITGTAVTTKPITGPNFVFNAAGFQSGAVAPGEMINIAGFNVGPATSVLAPAGDLPTTLGGVQVTFDGTPAALNYVSQYVITAQVPFGVQPGKQSSMQISYNNTSSDPFNIDVLTVVPGLYTAGANGKGLVTAVNQDGTINSLTNPAPTGSYVTIYAVGLGTLNPALPTGKVPPSSPLSYTNSTVSASIDGWTAPVTFAGAAPGFVGLYQVNLQVPTKAGSGARALTLYAGGGAPSQNDVTIWVK